MRTLLFEGDKTTIPLPPKKCVDSNSKGHCLNFKRAIQSHLIYKSIITVSYIPGKTKKVIYQLGNHEYHGGQIDYCPYCRGVL